MNRQEIGQRQVCPLCRQKGMTPDRGHTPAMKTNANGTKFCYRCGVEFSTSAWRTPSAPRRWGNEDMSSASVREKAMRTAGIEPLPVEPSSRVQAECLLYLERRGVRSSDVHNWRLHYSAAGPYANRVVFPCYGPGGLEFFVARAIHRSVEPKILHPAKGNVWPGKSEVVWGLNYVDEVDPEIVVCEGVFDAAVTPNGVAILGKFLSHRQMVMIALRARRVAVMLDGDAVQAAYQIRERMKREFPRLSVRVVELPDGKDPSDLGADEVQKILA